MSDAINRLLATLKSTGGWKIRSDGAIRCDCGCPITTACLVQGRGGYTIEGYRSAGLRIGLSEQECDEIASAADGDERHDVPLRARLLEACGLRADCTKEMA